MDHVSRAGLGDMVLVRMMVGVCCKRRWRMSLGRWVGMKFSGIVVVRASIRASGSRPLDAEELAGRVMRYL